MGLVFSGMTADARFLCKFMRHESLNHWYTYDAQHPVERMVNKISKKAQTKTCHPSKRPFGVGMLVAGIDETGTHLYETCPSANFFEYKAMAIGAKCQSAKTYLEKNFTTFDNISRDELIAHGVKALKASA
jgi:20S proteasome subunit alpha 6|tara:strand:+ start:338 stop:730 length:393 start_codon:yes stop_codon:yes gene_type:complete